MTIKDAAGIWNISERRVNELCKSGRINGAYRDGRRWVIPNNAVKPSDKRFINGRPERNGPSARLPLPVGISDYREACTYYCYVDKTMLIKDLLDERPKASLFTRPRRFGKTLNMDMLRTFFEKTEEDTSVYFKDKKIWAQGDYYRSFQGRYPVVFLSFKDIKKSTWEETCSSIMMQISREYIRHEELIRDNAIKNRDYYDNVIKGNITRSDLEESLKMLTMMLHRHYGVPAVVIIDEYDTPIQSGHMNGFYDEAIGFMRNLLSAGLKDNKDLAFGFLTGILRVAKESIFSGLNNLTINSVLDNKYSEYFGFTADEVRKMAEYYNAAGKYTELCEWYDGYRFGKTDIFNPWSVINYFNNGCEPRTFWLSTSTNDIIGEVLEEADNEIYDKLALLISGGTVTAYVDTSVIYPQIRSNPSSIFSFLLVAGYLKVVRVSVSLGGDFICELALPNKEISLVYRKEIIKRFDSMITQSAALEIEKALLGCDTEKLKNLIGNMLIRSVSFFDTYGESFYHGFALGICALLGNYYTTSNRESGEGRYDIQLAPMKNSLPGIIIELKSERDCNGSELKALAQSALKQINDKKYDTELKKTGVKTIYKYGVAFSGKNVEAVIE